MPRHSRAGRHEKAWADFARQVEAAGLIPRRCSHCHFQIQGGHFTVNWYPTTTTIYVCGTHSKKGRQVKGNVAKAIAAANDVPLLTHRKAKRPAQKRAGRMKRRLLKSSSHCRWCGVGLSQSTATLEHIIPLALGGSNAADNLTLACVGCNNARGHEMPEVSRHESRANFP